ncbi:MAG: hypothetical protein HYY61_06560 [Deltaproteobacteria bacterium]|nr:hypothetical protein [Deltaproteobacteria bacterium]
MEFEKIAFWALTYGILLGGCFAFLTWFNHPTVNNWLQKLSIVQLLTGLFCFIGGIVGLFYPLGEQMFTGDLIPAMVAIILGFTLSMTFIKTKPEFLHQLNQKIVPYQVWVGIIAIAAGIVHYFFWGTKNFF